jgi:hypothetical protein
MLQVLNQRLLDLKGPQPFYYHGLEIKLKVQRNLNLRINTEIRSFCFVSPFGVQAYGLT